MDNSKQKKLKRRFNSLSLFLIIIIILFVSVNNFKQTINGDTLTIPINDNLNRNEAYIIDNFIETSNDTIKKFKTGKEAYKFALNKLTNSKNFYGELRGEIYTLNPINIAIDIKVDFIKDKFGNKSTKLAAGHNNSLIFLAEYFDLCKYNDEFYARQTTSLDFDTLKPKIEDDVVFEWQKLSNKEYYDKYYIEPSVYFIDISDKSVVYANLRDTGTNYVVDLKLKPEIAYKPLIEVIKRIVRVNYDLTCDNLELVFNIDYYGNIKKIFIDAKAVLSLPFINYKLNLFNKFELIYSFSEENSVFELPEII